VSDPLNPLQFHYDTVDTGGSRPMHRVMAVHPATNQEVGGMTWTARHIRNISVADDFRRQGVATALWNEGQRIAAENPRIPAPKHSAERTDAGDAWARSVGGRIPRRVQ